MERKTTERDEKKTQDWRARFEGLLQDLLGGAELAVAALPPPLIAIIFGYSQVTEWKLASSAPGLFGPLKRLSDFSAQHVWPQHPALVGYYYQGRKAPAFIQGDTPLFFGRHAWRVKVGLGYDISGYLGIAAEGRQLGENSWLDSSFYGVQTQHHGKLFAEGQVWRTSNLGELYSGDTLDFVLDVDAGSLKIVVLKNRRRCVFTLPRDVTWVPHFATSDPEFSVKVSVIEPKQAGKADPVSVQPRSVLASMSVR